MKIGKTICTLLFPLLLVLALLPAACGTTDGFLRMCDYIRQNGDESGDGKYYSVSCAGENTAYRFSAMYYPEDGQLLVGVMLTGDVRESLMLMADGLADAYEIAYVAETDGNVTYAGRGTVRTDDVACRDLTRISGEENPGAPDRVQALLPILINGADSGLFGESGIKMSDLGLRY